VVTAVSEQASCEHEVMVTTVVDSSEAIEVEVEATIGLVVEPVTNEPAEFVVG